MKGPLYNQLRNETENDFEPKFTVEIYVHIKYFIKKLYFAINGNWKLSKNISEMRKIQFIYLKENLVSLFFVNFKCSEFATVFNGMQNLIL